MTDASDIERVVARSNAARRAVTVRMADVEAEAVEWLWYPYIPLGKLTLLEGDPGLGKTFLALQIASIVTRGDPFPEGDAMSGGTRKPSVVVYLSAEDGLADTLRPRLDSAGADVERVYAMTGVRLEADAEAREVPVTLADVEALEDAIRAVRPDLVVVDPLQAFLGADVDMHRSNETRPVLAGIARLAETYGCAIVLIRHLSKAQQKVMYRGQGSIDIVAAARSGLLVGEHPTDPRQRVFAHFKSSLAPNGPSLAFEIREGSFLWAGRVDISAEQLGGPPASDEDRDALADAKAFLLEVLGGGPVPVKEVLAEAAKASISKRTVERAKAALAVASKRRSAGNTGGGEWVWALPNTAENKAAPNPAEAALRNAEETSSGTTPAQRRLVNDQVALREDRAGRPKSALAQDRRRGVPARAKNVAVGEIGRPVVEFDTSEVYNRSEHEEES